MGFLEWRWGAKGAPVSALRSFHAVALFLVSKALIFSQRCASLLWSPQLLAKCRRSYVLMGHLPSVEIALDSERTNQNASPVSRPSHVLCNLEKQVPSTSLSSAMMETVRGVMGRSTRCSPRVFSASESHGSVVLPCHLPIMAGNAAQVWHEVCPNLDPLAALPLYCQPSSQEAPGHGFCCLCLLVCRG